MNVFCDKHHIGLLYSLQLLFEKRLGWNLYTPIGEEWFTSGFWKIAEPYGNHPSTISQFLSLNNTYQPTLQMPSQSTITKEKLNYYEILDSQNNTTHKAITLEQFKQMSIDIVIASIPDHIEPYKRLISLYQPKAKFIFQMGNMFGLDFSAIPNLMASTMPFTVSCNAIFYHQEFDLNIFKYVPVTGKKKISSFVHCLPEREVYASYRNSLPEFNFKAYGAGCPDEAITASRDVAKTMQESDFGWHIKPGGDGYGHTIHNWFACGRPVITRRSDYADKLAGSLLEDGVTCIDLEKRGFEDNLRYIKEYSEAEKLQKLALNASNRFKNTVNFDSEEQKIKDFLFSII